MGTVPIFRQLKIITEMIKIEHTIFALPFACMGAFLAAGGLPSLLPRALARASLTGAGWRTTSSADLNPGV